MIPFIIVIDLANEILKTKDSLVQPHVHNPHIRIFTMNFPISRLGFTSVLCVTNVLFLNVP